MISRLKYVPDNILSCATAIFLVTVVPSLPRMLRMVFWNKLTPAKLHYQERKQLNIHLFSLKQLPFFHPFYKTLKNNLIKQPHICCFLYSHSAFMLSDIVRVKKEKKSLQKAERVFVQGSFMLLSDPKARFKRVTQTDFVPNKSSLHCGSKEACAARRLDGMEERGSDKHSYLQRSYKCQYVRVCMCEAVLLGHFKARRMRGLLGDNGHLGHSCILFDMIANAHLHTLAHIWVSQRPSLTARQRIVSQVAAWVVWHHCICRIPLVTRSSLSVLPIPGEWQEVTQWWGGRVRQEAMYPRLNIQLCRSGG